MNQQLDHLNIAFMTGDIQGGLCSLWREKTVECYMIPKNEEAIHMLTWYVLLHCIYLYITQCCTLLMSAPWARSSSTSLGWLHRAAKYIGVIPSCIRNNIATVLIQILAMATINFSLAGVQLLIEGGSYLWVSFINFGVTHLGAVDMIVQWPRSALVSVLNSILTRRYS